MSISGVTHEDIVSISNDFWASMAAIPLSPVAVLPETNVRDEGILGHVEIRGGWKGTVEIRASRSLSEATASALLQKPLGQVTIEECFDAIQEATNIVAGSIKRLLPPICKIAIPAMSGCSRISPASADPCTLAVSFISASGLLSISVTRED